MDNCIFCKIVSGDMPSFKLYEDEHVIAILDIFPVRKGQAVVIPKTHTTSRYSDADETLAMDALRSARYVAKLLEEKLGCERCLVFVEGLGVNHFHVKVYPNFGEEGEFNAKLPDEPEKPEVLEAVLHEIIS